MVALDQAGWIGARAALTAPPVGLADLVEHSFILDFRGVSQRRWKILPDFCGHLIVHFLEGPGGDRVTACSVVGARKEALEIDVSARVWTVGVRLSPGALPMITGRSAEALTDRAVSAGGIWGADGDHLNARLSEHSDAKQALRTLLRFVRERVGDVEARDWRARGLARSVVQSGGRTTVAEAAKRLGLSQRSLRDQSRELVGLTPKRMARTHRLFLAVEAVRNVGKPAWGRVASGTGFADQPHLIREFRALLGESPTEFHARGRDASRADSFKTA